MIKEKTVFILGAGASKPYGFPTALELRRDIIYSFPEMFKLAFAEYNAVPNVNINLSPEYAKLIDTFNYSSIPSIDLFLSRNKHFYDIGKKIIAFLIAYYEIKSVFRENVLNPQYDWYTFVYNILTKNIINTEDLLQLFQQNEVSFVTFNYDRSLENFLYESIFNSFTSKRNEIKSLIANLNITHVYGKIAPLPWQDNGFTFKYNEPNIYGWLDELTSDIKIIYEQRNEKLEEIQQKISEARNIFFLGFGYANENLEALDFSNLMSNKHKIYGTGLGLTESEIIKIKRALKGDSAIIPEFVRIDDCDSVMLLRKYLE